MGQKVHPYGFRLGIVRDWQSRWYSDTEYRDFVIEDDKIRKYLRQRLPGLFAAGAKRGGGGRGGRGVEAGVSHNRDRAHGEYDQGHTAHRAARDDHRARRTGDR